LLLLLFDTFWYLINLLSFIITYSISHDIADKHELVAISFGIESVDRHSVVYKKEFKPNEEELEVLRKGDAYDRKLKELQEEMVRCVYLLSNRYFHILILLIYLL